ncbi:hypothetical protein L1049_008471 [Liquidambar formosana]|uniref:Uncharacterized protein n=1 Tax=Liquidambar formosana TaxID=63359 RepID=A0AAP0X2C9_LIQFO
MGRWRAWLCFKSSFLFPTKGILHKITSSLRHEAKGNEHGLVSLYKDMESCGGYEDIQVMWEMIHSSCPQNGHSAKSSKKPSYWRFCFRPT